MNPARRRADHRRLFAGLPPLSPSASSPMPPQSSSLNRRHSASFPTKRPRAPSALPPVMPEARKSHPAPPRSYQATVEPFSLFIPQTKEEQLAMARLHGAPRLSSLAMAAARVAAARGHLLDLSKMADDHVFLLLTTPAIGAAQLKMLERHNPTRVAVLDALWARLVKEKDGTSKLPDKVTWWRELYEIKMREDQMRLEKASERLRRRYSDGEMEKGRKVEITKRIRVGPPRRRNAEAGTPQSRMSRLREEVRRQKRRR